MVVALKSLPSGTMLNIVGFGTTIKPLFTSSKLCTDVSLTQLPCSEKKKSRLVYKISCQTNYVILHYICKTKTHWIVFPRKQMFSAAVDYLSCSLSNQAIGRLLGLP